MTPFKEKAHMLADKLIKLANDRSLKIAYETYRQEPEKINKTFKSMHNMTLEELGLISKRAISFPRRHGKTMIAEQMIQAYIDDRDTQFGVVYYKDRRWLASALIDNPNEFQCWIVNHTDCAEDILELEKQLFERL